MAASQLDLRGKWEALSNIQQVASSIRDRLKVIHRNPTPPAFGACALIPNLILPPPDEILAPILTLQISERARQAILHSFSLCIIELQQEYANSYRRACQECIHGPNSEGVLISIHRAFQALYLGQCLPMLKSKVSFVQAEVVKRHQQSLSCDAKRPFNNEYTPMLEKYFEINAYPSAKHQEVLAEKSLMSRRQMEVWFQNHRNRSKKDGKPLRRLASDVPLQRALSALHERTPLSPDRSATPSDDGYASESMDENECLPQPAPFTDASDSFRPPHAFPTTFTAAKCGPDPFASDNGVFKFPPPIWMRTQATTPPSSPTSLPIDMDEFARLFHLKLNFLEGTGKRVTKAKPSKAPRWYEATTTIPPRGRHPAFKPLHSRLSSNILPTSFSFQFPVGSGTTSATNVFLPPSPPLRATPTTPSRKISRLPRRVPTSNLAPTAPSSPRNLSASSRSSSFSSDTSMRSRISSSSRNSTPEPSTPPPLPNMEITALPDPGLVQQQPDVYDFSDIFGADPDELLTSFSSSNFDFSTMNSMDPMLNKTPSSLFDITSIVSIPSSDYMATQS